MNHFLKISTLACLSLLASNVSASETYGQYKSVDEIPKLVIEVTRRVKTVSTLNTNKDCAETLNRSKSVNNKTVQAPIKIPTLPNESINSEVQYTPSINNSNITPSKTTGQKLNLNINCRYPGVETATFGGRLNLNIDKGVVRQFSASANGCNLNLKDFRQASRNDEAITMKNSKGCTVSLYKSLRSNRVFNGSYTFSVDNCSSTCGSSITSLFWQAEINPSSNSCK